MPFKKGQSGNPKGRPTKSRALTEILRKAGSRTEQVGDKRVARNRLVAEMLWELVATGRIAFPGDVKEGEEAGPPELIIADIGDWLAAVKWLYGHLDGPPKTELDVTSGGQPVKGYVMISPDDWDDEHDDGR